MPVVLDATLGGATANSYADVAYADAMLATQLWALGWFKTGRTTDQKSQALIEATRLIDQDAFPGYLVGATQALQWPRYSAYDRAGEYYMAGTVIPTSLKNAVCLLADWLLMKFDEGANPQVPSALDQFDQITLPGISITPSKSGFDPSALPAHVIREYAWLRASGSSFRVERA